MTAPAMTFDLVSQAYKRDPFPTYLRMHAASPVSRTRIPFIGEVWMVSSYDGVQTLLKDTRRFVQNPGNAGRKERAGLAWWMPRLFSILTDHMLGSDEPDHRRLRGLVDRAFGRRGVEGMRPRIEAIADELLDRIARRPEADLVAEFARPLPLTVICELLGLPHEDRPSFTRWVEAMTRPPSAIGIVRSFPALYRMSGYLRAQFERRRRDPGDDLITSLVEAEEAGERLSGDELLSMVFLLLVAGHETTVHLLGSGSLALMQHPDQRARLTAAPELIVPAVEELLRYTSPVEFATVRYAAEDVTMHGATFRRGDHILPAIGAANCDPARFADPTLLDITRHPNPHLALGTGIHFCLGQQLARLEARIAIERLFTRFTEMMPLQRAEETEWRGTLGLRGLARLPVSLGAER